jgi:hypothetical protein
MGDEAVQARHIPSCLPRPKTCNSVKLPRVGLSILPKWGFVAFGLTSRMLCHIQVNHPADTGFVHGNPDQLVSNLHGALIVRNEDHL